MQASDAELIDEFIDALWLADGLSKNTLGAYRSDLALFAAWLGAQGKSIVGADGTAINAYLAHLHARPGGIRANSQRLMSSRKPPPCLPKPPSARFAAITRWQGTTIG